MNSFLPRFLVVQTNYLAPIAKIAQRTDTFTHLSCPNLTGALSLKIELRFGQGRLSSQSIIRPEA